MEALVVVLFVALIGVGGLAVWALLRPASRAPADDGADALRLEQQTQRLEAQLQAAKTDLAQLVGEAQRNLLQQVSNVDQKVDDRLSAVRSTMDSRLEAVQTTMGQRLSAVQTDLTSSLTSTQETIGRIGEQLGGLNEQAKRIAEVGQDVSSLKDVLSPPKLRGAFGELLLEQLLKQVLPSAHYETQYTFKDGTRVDAIIRTPDGLVPVDSKFPIDSYRRLLEAQTDDERARLRKAFIRDVRARVEEVAKYIRPDESTMDFACMYVPAEGIFYEIIAGGSEEESMTFALERQVHLVSPNTFYALLQVVARGLARLQVQEDVKEFMARLAQVRRDFSKFRSELETLGTHIGRAKNKYDEVDKWADKLDNRLAASTHEPLQAPLPVASAAPAPLGDPMLPNGNGHGEQ
jgi:DNA recombination protein RmuC